MASEIKEFNLKTCPFCNCDFDVHKDYEVVPVTTSWQARALERVAMSKKDKYLAKLKRQVLEDRQRLFDSMPEDKRLELERQEGIDVPQFMRDWEKRINKARRKLPED